VSCELSFACSLPNGLHARPATQVMQLAERFSSDIQLVNNRTGQSANAKSILSLIAGDFRQNDPCTLRTSGSDAETAAGAIARLFTSDLPASEIKFEERRISDGLLPHFFQECSFKFIRGAGVVPGVAEGSIDILPPAPQFDLSSIVAGSVQAERACFSSALADLRRQLEEESASACGTTRDILRAHYSIARDAEFEAQVFAALENPGTSVAAAITAAGASISGMLQRTGSRALQERCADIHDVCERLIGAIYTFQKPADTFSLKGPTILCAHSISPQRLLSLDRKWLRGLLLTEAGSTSHAVILARSFGIPVISGIEASQWPAAGVNAIMDGRLGVCVPNPEPIVQTFFEHERNALQRRNSRFGVAAKPARTSDGEVFDVHANVVSADGVTGAVSAGMDGVGLFRTEMLFIGRASAPDEAEQYDEYVRALKSAGNSPVTFRLLDLGGDKTPAYLRTQLSAFTTLRGAQLYAHIPGLLRTQLRALLRAATAGRARILVPMVSSPAQVGEIRRLIRDIGCELRGTKVAFDGNLPVGAMIESVDAADAVREIGKEADFFSVGTNDLTQSFLGKNRETSDCGIELAKHKDFLALLQRIAESARACGKPVTVCGELASNLRNLPLLIGAGVTGVSVPAQTLAAIKAALSGYSARACRAAVVAQSFEALRAIEQPLLCPELINLESSSRTQAEVMRELANLLYSSGRTDDPEQVEAALSARERANSTGFGHGFAVPHCKSDAIIHSSIAVLRVKEPIQWNAIDSEPVSTIVLLAMNETSAQSRHLAVFSLLARNLMKEDFRTQVLSAPDGPDMLRNLQAIVAGEAVKTRVAAG